MGLPNFSYFNVSYCIVIEENESPYLTFLDYNWCLRFRYYINSEYTTLDVIIYSTLENVTHTLEKSLQEEWKYKECDIKGEDFRVRVVTQ